MSRFHVSCEEDMWSVRSLMTSMFLFMLYHSYSFIRFSVRRTGGAHISKGTFLLFLNSLLFRHTTDLKPVCLLFQNTVNSTTSPVLQPIFSYLPVESVSTVVFVPAFVRIRLN